MTKGQSNYLNMARSVSMALHKNEGLWTEEQLIHDGLEDIDITIVEIEKESTKQKMNETPAITAKKDEKRIELEDQVFLMATRITVFAGQTGDTELAKKTNIPRNQMSRLSMNKLQTIVRVIIELAETYIDLLEPYQITQAEIDILRQLAASALRLFSERKETQNERTENTSHLAELFGKLRSQFKMMDKIMEGFVKNKEMLNIYLAARHIEDTRGRIYRKPTPSTPPTDPTDPETPSTN